MYDNRTDAELTNELLEDIRDLLDDIRREARCQVDKTRRVTSIVAALLTVVSCGLILASLRVLL